MPIITMARITRDHLRETPEALFVFGDNMQRRGLGGQAKEMRGETNAVGIPTKWAPYMTDEAFFSDADFPRVKAAIDGGLVRLAEHVRAGGLVVLPEAGIGSGLAHLHAKAPRVAAYIDKALERLQVLAEASSPVSPNTGGGE